MTTLCYCVKIKGVINMAYFLKKTNLKKGQYLQIYDGFYDPEKGYAVQRSHSVIGYTAELIQSGIDDPISYYQQVVDELNMERKLKKEKNKIKQIGNESPERYLGHFPIKNINDGLKINKYFDLLQSPYQFEYKTFDILSSLIYARMIKPCSKLKTFHDVVPKLFENYKYSSSQMYSAINFFGSEYEKIIEIYNHAIESKFDYNTTVSYFDCTNFYFEIDKEDSLRRKGPSKERRTDPIIGMGLLLDANQIPLGMKLYPGNQSEMPVLGEVINELKTRQNITGRTIRVADKGLNSANNIADAIRLGDGYIFSKSVVKLSGVEKTWLLSGNDYISILDEKGLVKYKIKETVDKFPYTITSLNEQKLNVKYKEKRVVTFNPSLAKKKTMEIYKQIEKAKNLKASQAKKDEYGDSSKYVVFKSTDKDGEANKNKIAVSMNQKKIDEDLKLAGYNMIVTSEIGLTANEIYTTYHNLWRIEESFRVMKSELDARPVYLQNENSIYGHFLICYLSVLLLRILQFKILHDVYCSTEIMRFIQDLRVVKVSETKYINISKTTSIGQHFSKKLGLPVVSYFLNNGQIKTVLNHRFR